MHFGHYKNKSIAFFCALTLTTVHATEIELTPMTIAAGKRPAETQDVPQSVSVFDARMLESSQVLDIANIAQRAPNLSFYSVGSRRTALMYIRGLGSFSCNSLDRC